MKDSPKKKPKPSLESLLADKQLVTGKQVIENLKQKEAQMAEFALAAEFEQRNQKSRK